MQVRLWSPLFFCSWLVNCIWVYERRNGISESVFQQMGVKHGYSDQLLLRPLLQGHRYPEVLHKVVEFPRCGLEIVLLDRMANVVNDYHLEFALHLSYCELLVHPFLLSCQKYFGDVHVEENMRKTFEPSQPVFLGVFQVDLPSPVLMPVLFDLHQLAREGNSRWLQLSDGAGVVAPFDACVQRIEVFWSVRYDLVHKGKSFDSRSLNHVNHDATYYTFEFFHICESVYNAASDRSTQGMANNDDILFWETLEKFFEDFNCLCIESLYREIIIPHIFFGKTMTFQVVSQHSTEIFNFLGESGEAESWMSSSVDAEKHDSFLSCLKNWGPLSRLLNLRRWGERVHRSRVTSRGDQSFYEWYDGLNLGCHSRFLSAGEASWLLCIDISWYGSKSSSSPLPFICSN